MQIPCDLESQGNKVSFIQLKLFIILFQESKHKKEVVKKLKRKLSLGKTLFPRFLLSLQMCFNFTDC